MIHPLARFLAIGCLAAGCSPAPTICDSEAGVLPVAVEVPDGAECGVARLSVPPDSSLACGSLPDDFVGARVAFIGRPGVNWRVTLQRTDARAELLCAAVLDESCACARGECTTTPTQPLLVLDLGTVTRDEVELVLPAGTYEAELCAR